MYLCACIQRLRSICNTSSIYPPEAIQLDFFSEFIRTHLARITAGILLGAHIARLPKVFEDRKIREAKGSTFWREDNPT